MGGHFPQRSASLIAGVAILQQTRPPMRAAHALLLTYLPTLSERGSLVSVPGRVSLVPEPIKGHSVFVLEHIGGVVSLIRRLDQVLDSVL